MTLAFTYAIFAMIATAVNIGVQDIAVRLYSGPFYLAVSILAGTAVGLVVKYVLDKRYIFRFRTHNVAHDGQTFILYTVMGLATTAIFWGFEFTFHHMFETDAMRYLGGVIGLAVGYVTKYHLDRKYVFRQEAV
ncbi:MAG: GtrA family protein [Agrobacterium sp.]|nr:GtrA family protein [Agrobacterium sp.]